MKFYHIPFTSKRISAQGLERIFSILAFLLIGICFLAGFYDPAISATLGFLPTVLIVLAIHFGTKTEKARK